jgi:hypothetical protein
VKVRCIRLLNDNGDEVEFSPWLTLGRVYHVMSYTVVPNRGRYFGIITSHPEGEWPQMGSHSEKCFEIVSDVIPSNWRSWHQGELQGASPVAWQKNNFFLAFSEHDPDAYSVFEQERDLIVSEDL